MSIVRATNGHISSLLAPIYSSSGQRAFRGQQQTSNQTWRRHSYLSSAWLRRQERAKRHFCCQAAESPASDSSADQPYSEASLEELKDRLELTVLAEDYKVAAAIRDEIRQRESEADAAVREAHQEFYNAFGAANVKAMDKIWGSGDHVRVMHPGSECIFGRNHVMQSWRLILENSGGFNIMLDQVQIHTTGNLAIVTCLEVMRSGNAMGRTAATNVLERQHGRWVMIHHQGGPLPTIV